MVIAGGFCLVIGLPPHLWIQRQETPESAYPVKDFNGVLDWLRTS
jgi:hypothetical protein